MLPKLAQFLLLAPLVAASPAQSVLSPLGGNVVPDQYIIMLKDGSTSANLQTVISAVGTATGLTAITNSINKILYQYDFGAVKGLAAKLDATTVSTLQALPNVAYIEKDGVVSTTATATQSAVPYALARISHTSKGATNYVYSDTAGSGTYAYVIDTGINTAHTEFGGRATWGTTIVVNSTNDDKAGHGTHVAGIIGSKTYGVAKNVNLIAVKVLGDNGQGSTSDAIAGMQWVVKDAQNKGRVGKTVVNMSLGGGFGQALNDAANAIVSAGVAAGNDNKDAKDYSPASAATACTVGAIDSNDAQSTFSNWGSTLDIYAPGTSILSTWIGSTSATATLSGTSMAAPHVAGLGAYLLSIKPTLVAKTLCDTIVANATSGKITSLGSGSPNKLAYNGSGQ